MTLPNFIIIGARGAGTSWIHNNLLWHPEIFLSKNVKEIHFFDRQFEKGAEFYSAFFKDAKDETAIGEATPAYMYEPDVAQRIHSLVPEAKLIACLRDPVDLLYTRYLKSWAKGGKANAADDVKDLVKRKPEVIEQGFFADHLQRFFDTFGAEKICLVKFDDLKNRPQSFMNQITDFLGVSPNFEFPFLTERINVSASKKHLSRSFFLYYLMVISHRIGMWKLARKIERLNAAHVPGLDLETREWLIQNHYGSKNIELQDRYGFDISGWNDV